jgi:acetyl-CoA acyltransferase
MANEKKPRKSTKTAQKKGTSPKARKPAARPVRPTAARARGPAAREAVIVASVRTAVGKAPKGTLRQTRPDDMAAAAIRAALARVPALRPEQVEDVILGCAMPEAEQGMNVARQAALLAGIPSSAAAMTVNRFCASGLQAIALAARAIEAGEADVIVAGGTESMSLIPMGGHKISPSPTLVETYPDVYLGMGLTAENVARKYGIGREAADRFALDSHRKAVAAIDAGRFKDEIVSLDVRLDGAGKTVAFDADEGPRRDTDLAALAKLKPAFAADGVVTAGNASQMSDGAAATVLMSADKARELGLRPIARLVAHAVAGVPPELMGIGPVEAIPKALRQAGLTLADIDLVELNEAFACQALAVIEAAGLPPERVNVNGGAVALGHPLGCTGAKLTTQVLHEMARRGSRYGLVTMCVGGGMGAAGIFERL